MADATGCQLALGANRALLGAEIVQFARTQPLGEGRWRLTQFLRGRGGTESALVGHAGGESFVLIDARPVAIDPTVVGSGPEARVVAVGFGDDLPVTSAIALRGITLRPPSPVLPRVAALADGALELRWTRRARGAWAWPDGVDAPLHEQAERYLVTLGVLAAPLAVWELGEPRLTLSPETLATLPGGS